MPLPRPAPARSLTSSSLGLRRARPLGEPAHGRVAPRERLLRADAEDRAATSTTHARGASTSGNSRSPRSRPSTVPPSRKYGTSAPSAGRDRANRRASSTRHSAPSARSAAAASLLPPPSPACSGIRFVESIATSRGAPRRPAAFHTPLGGAPDQIACRRPDSAGSSQVSRNGAAAPRGSSACRAARSTERSSAARGSRRPDAEHAQRQVNLRERPDARWPVITVFDAPAVRTASVPRRDGLGVAGTSTRKTSAPSCDVGLDLRQRERQVEATLRRRSTQADRVAAGRRGSRRTRRASSDGAASPP